MHAHIRIANPRPPPHSPHVNTLSLEGINATHGRGPLRPATHNQLAQTQELGSAYAEGNRRHMGSQTTSRPSRSGRAADGFGIASSLFSRVCAKGMGSKWHWRRYVGCKIVYEWYDTAQNTEIFDSLHTCVDWQVTTPYAGHGGMRASRADEQEENSATPVAGWQNVGRQNACMI
jgi:hypothetical protein